MVRNKLHWTQMTQWDFQNKRKSGWTFKSSFVLEVPLRYLRPRVIYSVPCDRILQRADSDVFKPLQEKVKSASSQVLNTPLSVTLSC